MEVENASGNGNKENDSKVWLHYSGTGWSGDRSKDVIVTKKIEENDVRIRAIHGVATPENMNFGKSPNELEQVAQTNQTNQNWFQRVTGFFSNQQEATSAEGDQDTQIPLPPVSDSTIGGFGQTIQDVSQAARLRLEFTSGYSADTHMKQFSQVFQTLDAEKSVDLLLTSHSRGIIGIKAFLFQLYLLSKQEGFKEDMQKFKSISGIFSDPVDGFNLLPNEDLGMSAALGDRSSDDMGLKTAMENEPNVIKYMMDEISRAADNENLFKDITILNTRFDQRNYFSLDPDIQNLMKAEDSSIKVFHVGFGHEFMLEPENKGENDLDLKVLYPDPEVTPTKFFQRLIEHSLGLATIEEVNELAQKLEDIDLDLLDRLSKGEQSEAINFLREQTSPNHLLSRFNPTNPGLTSLEETLRLQRFREGREVVAGGRKVVEGKIERDKRTSQNSIGR